jgi:hypothetical protein
MFTSALFAVAAGISHERQSDFGQGPAPAMGCEPRAVDRRRRESALHVALSFEETETGNQITVDVSRSRVRLPISLIRLPFGACSLAEPGSLMGFRALTSTPHLFTSTYQEDGQIWGPPMSQGPANALHDREAN